MEKDFFDSVLEKTKNLYYAASQKTDEVISVEKLKIKQASFKSKISKDYKELGQLYYNNNKDAENLPEDFKKIIEDIKLNFSLIEKAQQEIDNIKKSGGI